MTRTRHRAVVRVLATPLAVGALAALLVAPATDSRPAAAAEPDALPLRFEIGFGGWDRSSSPQIADVDGDGRADVAFGAEDGRLRVVDAAGHALAGWPREARIGGAAVAIDSTVAIHDLDQDGSVELVVGVGSTHRPRQQGGIVVFAANGTTRCTFRTADVFDIWTDAPRPDGYSDAVFSSPAIGDIDGDGYEDIVFGSFDHRVHALDRACRPLRGFPLDVTDTVWSSPALHDVDGDGRQEIFIGADFWANGPGDPASGGRFRRLDWESGRVVTRWTRASRDVFTSSAAIGDIDGDGRLEAVIGGGNFFHRADGQRVWAFHLDNGSDVAGWPKLLGGYSGPSPALGDLTGDGVPEVVAGSRDGYAQAFRGNGSLLWRTRLSGFGGAASPIVADLDGDGDQDVAIGDGFETTLLRGHDGVKLGAVNRVISYESSPAVGSFGAAGRLLITIGFDTPNVRTRLRAFELPASGATDAWPVFGRNARNLRAAPSDPPIRPQCEGRASRRAPTAPPAPFRAGPALDVDGTYDHVAATNVDGDRRCDVVLYGRAAAADGQLRLTAGGVPEVVSPDLAGLGDAVVGLDYDADGRGDLAIYAAGAPSDYLRKGSGFGFVNGHRIELDAVADVALPGDFNGDGRGDVLLYGRGSRADALWLGTAKGLTAGPPLTLATSFDLVVSGDFDGDGVTDLLGYQEGAAGEILRLGTRDGVFRSGTAPAIAAHYDGLVAADFNGDGCDDLVAYGAGASGDTLRRGGRAGLGRAQAITITQTFDHLVAGDLDGDLHADLVGIGNGSAPDRIWLGR